MESSFKQEWDNILLPKLQQLNVLAHRRLQTVVKSRGGTTQWESWPSPNSLLASNLKFPFFPSK